MYKIDLKIYEPIQRNEFFWVAPIEMERRNKSKEGDMGVPLENVVLRTGYHSLLVDIDENELSDFYLWAADRGAIIKILGSQDLGHVDL